MERQASCHCGQLTLSCSGEPAKVSLCHCLDCQRRTGSLFSVAAFYPRERVALGDGKSARYRRGSASGYAVTFHFCPHCGSSVWWEPERMSHLIGVAVGAFADPTFPMPKQAVWASNRHEWLALPDEMPAHAENPVRPKPTI
jgi:hypothetical protein